MYKSNLDFSKISKAIESAYQHLQMENIPEDAIDHLREAQENLQSAMQYSLTTPIIKHTYK